MSWLVNNIEIFTGIAEIVTAVVALSALFIAITQLRQNKANQRESTAKEIYKEYLKMAVEYPRHAYPTKEFIENIRGKEEFDRYTWFVSYMLFACDEILTLSKERKLWRKVVKEQLWFHISYLSSPDFYQTAELEGYGHEMNTLVIEMKQKHDKPIQPTHIVRD